MIFIVKKRNRLAVKPFSLVTISHGRTLTKMIYENVSFWGENCGPAVSIVSTTMEKKTIEYCQIIVSHNVVYIIIIYYIKHNSLMHNIKERIFFQTVHHRYIVIIILSTYY